MRLQVLNAPHCLTGTTHLRMPIEAAAALSKSIERKVSVKPRVFENNNAPSIFVSPHCLTGSTLTCV